MAPEKYLGRTHTKAADQYAFCIALWEALCGAPPFAGKAADSHSEKFRGPPRWPANAAASGRVGAVCSTCAWRVCAARERV
jgi:hypothetical protein